MLASGQVCSREIDPGSLNNGYCRVPRSPAALSSQNVRFGIRHGRRLPPRVTRPQRQLGSKVDERPTPRAASTSLPFQFAGMRTLVRIQSEPAPRSTTYGDEAPSLGGSVSESKLPSASLNQAILAPEGAV